MTFPITRRAEGVRRRRCRTGAGDGSGHNYPGVEVAMTVALSFGGGRQTTALLLMAVNGELPRPDYVVFAALSDGQLIDNPRNLQVGQVKLRCVQRKVARRKKGSNGRRKAVRLLQKAHAHIRNQRSDFHHKASRQIADSYGLIAVEDLNIKGLARSMLARSVNDAGWGSFLAKLTYKAEEAGARLIKVNPNGTSQVCSQCGSLPDVPKTLSDRIHFCPHCGLALDRDINAARNILRLGLSLAGPTWTNRPCVPAEATLC